MAKRPFSKIRTTKKLVFGEGNSSRTSYDEGHNVYDSTPKPTVTPSDDPYDLEAAEANPISDKNRTKRQKIADALRDKAERLQELEDEPEINYTGDDGSGEGTKWKRARKAGIIIGGTSGMGILGGLGLFSLGVGPAQLINMSEIVGGYHMGPQEEESNQSTWRLIKYAYHYSKGQAERSRLGFFSNKLADRYEGLLNGIGLTSKYTRAGFFQGIALDRENDRFKGLSDKEIIDTMKEEGVNVKPAGDLKNSGNLPADTLIIDQNDMTKRQTRKYISSELQRAGINKADAFVGSRVMNKRFGKLNTLLHPIKALDDKALRIAEKVVTDFKTRLIDHVRNKGAGQITTDLKENKDAPQENKDAAKNVQNDVNSTVQEGADAEKSILSGDTEAPKRFQDTLTGKTAGKAAGALAILSLPCILKGINADYSARRQELQVLPLGSNFAQQVAVGDQTKSSVDTTAPQQGPWADRLVGPDRFGNLASAFDADAITAMTGEASKNQPPTPALARIMEGKPFPAIDAEPIKSALVGICSAEVQGATLILGIITGPFSTAASTIASSLVVDQVEQGYRASWASNTPFNPFDSGVNQGNDLAYGGLIMGNQNSLAHGGSPVSAGAAQQIHKEYLKAQLDEFNSKSIAYRLFNPHDYRTPVARFIDHQNPKSGPLATFASALTGLTNMAGTFSSTLLSTLSGKSSAEPREYNYSGMGTVGASANVMNNTDLEVVPQVDQKTTDLLDSSNGQKWVDQAKKCKGVTIAKDSSNRWNAYSDLESAPKLEDMFSDECREGSSPTWDMVSMWIRYTVQANNDMCTMGSGADAQQGCEDSGWSSNTCTSTDCGNTGTSDPGVYKDPFRDIEGKDLTAGRIDQGVDYSGSGKIYSLGNAKVTYISHSCGWPGCNFIEYQLSDGPAQGKYVYFAEDCTPTVKVGDTLNANTVICNMYHGGNGIEIGWSAHVGGLALGHPQYTYDGLATAYGYNMSELLKKLGAPGGIQKSKTVNGTLPADWPKW